MSMEYVRRTYDVPAKRGGRVRLGVGFGGKLAGCEGTITSADYRLRIRLDGDTRPQIFHPTWELTYL